MKIDVPSTIPFSRSDVFRVYRDHLCDLVEYLPNVRAIEVKNRSEPDENRLDLENHWYAEASIPKIAQSMIKPEMLKWIDYASWDKKKWTCDWRIETGFAREAITCTGHNTFEESGDDHMQLRITGELSIDAKQIPGVPRLLAGKIKPQLEKFVIALITPNFHKINRGIEQFLKAQQ